MSKLVRLFAAGTLILISTLLTCAWYYRNWKVHQITPGMSEREIVERLGPPTEVRKEGLLAVEEESRKDFLLDHRPVYSYRYNLVGARDPLITFDAKTSQVVEISYLRD